MASTFSPSLRLELIASGSQSGTWGVTTNNNLGDLIEQAISGVTNLNVTGGDLTLSALNGVTDQSRSAVLSITGTPGTPRTITIPNVSKTYTVKNRANAAVNIKTSSGVAFSVPTLAEAYIYCDGNDAVTGRVITDAANAFTSNTNPLNNTALTGIPIAPTAAPGTNNTQIATTAFVQTALPIGSVIMWFGSLGTIPTGWQICDGTNGTPDLRDRFVVGAGTTYALGDTGGANTVTLDTTQIPSHTHTGTTANRNIAHTHGSGTIAIGNTDLTHSHTGSGTTSDRNVDHTHSGTTGTVSNDHVHGFSGSGSTNGAGGHSHSINDPGHAHSNGRIPLGSASGNNPALSSVDGNTGVATTNISINGVGDHAHSFGFSGTTGGISANHSHGFSTGGMSANAVHNHTYSFTTVTALGNHNHPVSGSTAAMSANESHNHTFTTDVTGGGLSHENRPPYLALFYIMRV
jgi:microcystin-dependent protein